MMVLFITLRAQVVAVQKEEVLEDGRTIGRIVWAKLTARSKAWPGITILGSNAAQSPASAENQWVFWYGEHKVSEVRAY